MSLLKRVAAVLGILVGVAAVGLFLGLNRIVHDVLERGASRALGVQTDLGAVWIHPFTGAARIGSLAVANPPGFDRPHFLVMDHARVDLEEGASPWQPVVRMRELRIEGVEVDLDKRNGQANYQVILRNLRRFEARDPEPAEDDDPGKRFVIREVVIRDLVAHVRVVERRAIPQVEVEVPEVRLHDLGSAGRPLTAAEVSNILTKATLASIARSGADLPGGVARAITRELGGLARVPVELPRGGRIVRTAEETAEGADRAAEAAEEALDAGREAAEDAGRAVRGLGRKLLD